MFNTKREFEIAMLSILTEIKKGNCNFNKISKPFDCDAFNEALVQCIEDKLVTGYTYTREQNDPQFNCINPRITYEGLKFIESVDRF